MEIKTKFNIGDKIFYMYKKRVREAFIEEIRMSVRQINRDIADDIFDINILYVAEDYERGGDNILEFIESEIFTTKKELLKSL